MLTEKMFVTAEATVSPKPGVWVMLETWSVTVDGIGITPAAFVVRTSTGYRAEIAACMFEGHPTGYVNCTRPMNGPYGHGHSGMSVNDFLEHSRSHCHGYHQKRAEMFRDEVASTYRRANIPKPTGRPHVNRAYLEAELGLTSKQLRDLIAQAHA